MKVWEVPWVDRHELRSCSLKMQSAQMRLRSIADSHGKVMESRMKATVGALFMFDMGLFSSLLRQRAVLDP